MILVGSGNEVSCRASPFSIPLYIDAKTFQSNAFLLDIDNDINIILGTLGWVDLGRLTWDFTTMEVQYYYDRRPISFTTVLPQHTPQIVLTLPAPPPVTLAPWEQLAPPLAPSCHLSTS